MRKIIALFIIFALILTMITGCGKRDKKDDNPEETVEPTAQAVEETVKENPVGSYKLLEIKAKNYEDATPKAEVSLMESMGLICGLYLKEDGAGILDMYGDQMPITWTDTEMDYMGQSTSYVLQDGILSILIGDATMLFEKTSAEIVVIESANMDQVKQNMAASQEIMIDGNALSQVSEDVDVGEITGTYKLFKITDSEKTITRPSQVQDLVAGGLMYGVQMNSDGSGIMFMDDLTRTFSWNETQIIFDELPEELLMGNMGDMPVNNSAGDEPRVAVAEYTYAAGVLTIGNEESEDIWFIFVKISDDIVDLTPEIYTVTEEAKETEVIPEGADGINAALAMLHESEEDVETEETEIANDTEEIDPEATIEAEPVD